eukprot:TRINITY_DN6307_c0_g1_i1.p1 TRINITY_DN6307_c0_g1~~TRINITY_DN6307_c0_g1_i1.p1  ORF type:complete len:105 (+),score=6.61 TRINITY_DN6307_c0_g1_i1:273-587(+)
MVLGSLPAIILGRVFSCSCASAGVPIQTIAKGGTPQFHRIPHDEQRGCAVHKCTVENLPLFGCSFLLELFSFRHSIGFYLGVLFCWNFFPSDILLDSKSEIILP